LDVGASTYKQFEASSVDIPMLDTPCHFLPDSFHITLSTGRCLCFVSFVYGDIPFFFLFIEIFSSIRHPALLAKKKFTYQSGRGEKTNKHKKTLIAERDQRNQRRRRCMLFLQMFSVSDA
jgi:hypothetical protein